jgi:NAD+ diphosphatase
MNRQYIYNHYEPAVTDPNADWKCGYWFVFSSNRLLILEKDSDIKIPLYKDLDEISSLLVNPQYLGIFFGKPCYCTGISKDAEAPQGMSFMDLRSTYGILDEASFLLAGKAIQIVAWDDTHRFCGKCGSPTSELPGERAKICPECGFISYPRISPAVITAVFKDVRYSWLMQKPLAEICIALLQGLLRPGKPWKTPLKEK